MAAVELRIMSFNIRTALAQDGPHHWDLRKDLVVDAIRDANPDLLGIQEPTAEQ
ncbi:MAG: endonuclease/exonuclease/phosphatase family protein [bacterium]